MTPPVTASLAAVPVLAVATLIGIAGPCPSVSFSHPRPGPSVGEAVRVLGAWDGRRAAAYSAEEPAALRSLYLRSSSAGTADVRLLRAYAAHGLRVHGLRMQVFSLRLLVSRDGVLRLAVVDRVGAGWVVGRRQCWAMPVDRPAERVLELRRVGGAWRLASVSVRG